MISKKIAKEVLNVALATGADFAEIYLEDGISSNINIENEKVDSSTTSVSMGCGIRLLNKFQSVYGHTNNVSRSGLVKLAFELSQSFKGERVITVDQIKTKHVKNINKIEIPFESVGKEEIINVLKENCKIMKDFDSRIVRTLSGFMYSIKKVVIFNSDGKNFIDDRSIGRMYFQCVATENGKMEYSFNGPGTKAGWEFFTNAISTKDIAKKSAEICIKMLGAQEAPAGIMPVVLGNGWGGVLFHESCGHPLEASAVSKGLSCFSKDMVGKKIASSVVNAYDDGTIPNAWGSSNMDDEGNKLHKTCLIKNGVLQDFLVDRFNGRRMNHDENGASRRQNYTYEPTSRMSNTYIGKGKSTREEIIAATKLGLYAVSFNGGSVDPTTGEFNFGCSEAYIIRDGKIAEPVRGATLIGKGNEILKQIDMVADDLDLAQGMCGAASGSIPTNVGQPTLRIKSITVGGRGGELKWKRNNSLH